VQEIMALLPRKRANFIVEELVGFGADAARHRIACRVLCRILEHETPSEGALAQLIQEVLDGAAELCSHNFGSFVIRHILEFGLPEHRERIAQALCTDVMAYARHKHASHVVEASLWFCAQDDQRTIVKQLTTHKEQLVALASSQFGRHVVKALLAPQLPLDLRAFTMSILKPFTGRLQASRYGKSVLHSLQGRVPSHTDTASLQQRATSDTAALQLP
jgi:hypothetical protein